MLFDMLSLKLRGAIQVLPQRRGRLSRTLSDLQLSRAPQPLCMKNRSTGKCACNAHPVQREAHDAHGEDHGQRQVAQVLQALHRVFCNFGGTISGLRAAAEGPEDGSRTLPIGSLVVPFWDYLIGF